MGQQNQQPQVMISMDDVVKQAEQIIGRQLSPLEAGVFQACALFDQAKTQALQVIQMRQALAGGGDVLDFNNLK